MSFIRANFRKIQQSALPVLCELFNSRFSCRQPPNIGRFSKDFSHLLRCDNIPMSAFTPSGFFRAMGLYLHCSYRSFVIRLKEHLGGQPDVLIDPSGEYQNKLSCVDLIHSANCKGNATLSSRIYLDYILAAVFGIGICLLLANFNNILDILKFSLRLDNSLHANTILAFVDPSQKDNY